MVQGLSGDLGRVCQEERGLSGGKSTGQYGAEGSRRDSWQEVPRETQAGVVALPKGSSQGQGRNSSCDIP